MKRQFKAECIKEYFEYHLDCVYTFENALTLVRCKETGELFTQDRFNGLFKQVQ